MTEENVNPASQPHSLTASPSHSRPWLRAFLLTSAVFGSGLIVGMVLTSTVLWQRAFNPFRQAPGFEVERLMNEMQDELLLSPDQSKQLKEVVSSHNERMKAIRDEVDPKIQSELESLKKQVEAILRPEQAKRWNERYDGMQQRFRHFGPPGAPPGSDHERRPHGLPGDGMPFGPPNGPRPPDGMRQGPPNGVQPGPPNMPPDGVQPGPPNGPRPPDDMRGPGGPERGRPEPPNDERGKLKDRPVDAPR